MGVLLYILQISQFLKELYTSPSEKLIFDIANQASNMIKIINILKLAIRPTSHVFYHPLRPPATHPLAFVISSYHHLHFYYCTVIPKSGSLGLNYDPPPPTSLLPPAFSTLHSTVCYPQWLVSPRVKL